PRAHPPTGPRPRSPRPPHTCATNPRSRRRRSPRRTRVSADQSSVLPEHRLDGAPTDPRPELAHDLAETLVEGLRRGARLCPDDRRVVVTRLRGRAHSRDVEVLRVEEGAGENRRERAARGTGRVYGSQLGEPGRVRE